jgi:hypothetical protein
MLAFAFIRWRAESIDSGPPIKRIYAPMTSRKLDEIASDIDDASRVVEELQVDPDTDGDEKLAELHKTLEHATDTIEEIDEKEDAGSTTTPRLKR